MNQEGNKVYSVYCKDCPRISEENGDVIAGDAILIELAQIPRSRVDDIINTHHQQVGSNHRVYFWALDKTELRDALREACVV